MADERDAGRVVAATAPGKAILFGEHVVVYGRPAIAVPVHELRARAEVRALPAGAGTWIDAPDVDRRFSLAEAPADDPLAAITRLALERVCAPEPEDLLLRVTSTIPLARGLGSGTAVSTAIVRALAGFQRAALTARDVSDLVYEVEKLHHGTPSGIDNTVVAFGKPVFFIRDRVAEIFWVGKPFHLLLADTGVHSPTGEAVARVRLLHGADPARYERLFDEAAEIAASGRAAIETGRTERIGELMTRNQRLLEKIGVSSPDIERLVGAAMGAGALGAKLTGAGCGGHIIALVEPETAGHVEMMLRMAGAQSTLVTEVK